MKKQIGETIRISRGEFIRLEVESLLDQGRYIEVDWGLREDGFAEWRHPEPTAKPKPKTNKEEGNK